MNTEKNNAKPMLSDEMLSDEDFLKELRAIEEADGAHTAGARFLVVAREDVTTTYTVRGKTIREALRNFYDGDKDVQGDDIHSSEIVAVYRVEPDGKELDMTEEWEEAEDVYAED